MKILVDMRVHEPSLQELRAIPNVSVKVVASPEEHSRALPRELIRDCDVLFCTFPPANLEEMDALKLIQISSAGYTQVVGKGLGQRHVRVCNALGVFDGPIAEWNIAMMVNLARDMRGMMHNQDAEVWDRSARHQHEISGGVVGIWGYGGIGRQTARLAKALGMSVHVLTRNGVQPRPNAYTIVGTGDVEGVLPDKVFLTHQLDEFLQDLDFLILAMPHTSKNTGIVGRQELSRLKRSAFLLNPSRGPLVDEEALLDALRSDRIAGAALDTHYHYPMPAGHPLWHLPNVIMTPHISGSSLSPRFLERVWDIFVQNVRRLTLKEALLNELLHDEI